MALLQIRRGIEDEVSSKAVIQLPFPNFLEGSVSVLAGSRI